MRRMKRLLSLLLALALVLSYVPVNGMAEGSCAHHSHNESCGYSETGSCSFVCSACAEAKKPADPKPETLKPVETKPAEPKPEEPKPAETKPAEPKPEEPKPAETKPAEPKPEETKPAETTPAATEPAATTPAATEPAGTEPAATTPAATEPAGTEPAATTPAATEPAGTEPAATEPVKEKTTAKRGAKAANDYYYSPGVTYLRLRVDGAAAQDNDACLKVRNSSGQLVEVRNGDALENYGLYRGNSYTVVGIRSASGTKNYELTSNGQTLSIPSSGYYGSEEVLYYTFTMEKLYVTVKDSLGNLKANHPVHLDGKTVNTGSNGVADLGYVRRIYQMAPYIEYTKWDGTTGTVTAQRNSIQNAGSNWTLTIPVSKMANIRVHNDDLRMDITNATVLVDGKAATHDVDGYYKILLDRTAATQTYNFSISAPGFQPVTTSLALTDSMLDGVLPFKLQLAPLSITGDGTAVGSSVTLETGHSYNWSVDLPDGATLTNDTAASLQIEQTGSGWKITPLSPASAQTLKFGYTLKGTDYVKEISITVNKGSIAAPARPTVSGGDVDVTSITVTVPADTLLQSATVTISGGNSGAGKTLTFDNLAAENAKTVTFDEPLRGAVTFAYTYHSDRVNYSSGGTGSISFDYFRLVPRATLPRTAYAYTGQPIRPKITGEYIASCTYGSVSAGEYPLPIPGGDQTKLTTDNDLSYEFIAGWGATAYNDCPYAVFVALEDYCTTSTEKVNGGYPTSYTLSYTVVPRNITVTAQDQTLLVGETLDQSKYSITAGSLLDGHSMTVSLSGDTSKAGVGKDITVSAAIDGANGKYYNISTVPGVLAVKYDADAVTANCPAAVTYNGQDQKPVTVKHGDTALTEGSDYTITYQNNRNAGTATYEITGITFDKPISGSFTIDKKELTAADFVFTAPASLVYDGTEKHASVEPLPALEGVGAVTVKHDKTPKNAGFYTVSIDVAEGVNYKAASLTHSSWNFTIAEAVPLITWPVNSSTGIAEYTYNGQPQGEATVTMAGGEDYTVTYGYIFEGTASDGLPTDAGAYTVTAIVAKQPNYTAPTATTTVLILPKPVTPALQIVPETFTFDGSAKTCTVTVKDGDTLIDASEYILSYANNTAVGVATVTVTDKANGNYTLSTATASFLILPDASALEGIDETNVTSADQAAIDEIQTAMSGVDISAASAAAQAQWEALEERCTALEDRISEVAAAAQKITDDTGPLTDVKTSDLEEIQQLQALYESIKNNLTEAEKQALSNELAKLAALEKAIEETNDALADLAAAVEELEKDELVFADKAVIKALLEDAAALESNTYLTNAQKDLLSDLTDALDDMLDEFAAAEAVEALLNAMPTYAEPDSDSAIAKYLAAKEAYDKLSDEDKARVDPNAVARLGKLKKALTDYSIIKGNKAKWVKGSDVGLDFTADGHFDYFSSVEVDGTLLTKDQYEVKAGSTKIHLHTSVLKKLKTGGHIIAIYYAGEFEGVAVGTFSVVRSGSSPATGDSFNIWLTGGIALSSALALAALMFDQKKRKAKQ